jgi:hypothetical protein
MNYGCKIRNETTVGIGIDVREVFKGILRKAGVVRGRALVSTAMNFVAP